MKICPLTGEGCLKHKCYHVTDIDGKDVKSLDLCEDCIGQHIKSDAEPVPKDTASAGPDLVKSIMELVGMVMQNPELAKKKVGDILGPPKGLKKLKIPTKKCLECGTSLEDISKTSKLGCAKCYEFFKDELEPVIHHVQNGFYDHVGKVPKNREAVEIKGATSDDIISIEEYVLNLQLSMRLAIENEKYELCSDLKNRMTGFEGLRKRLEDSIEAEDFEQAHLIREEMQKFMKKDITKRIGSDDAEAKK